MFPLCQIDNHSPVRARVWAVNCACVFGCRPMPYSFVSWPLLAGTHARTVKLLAGLPLSPMLTTMAKCLCTTRSFVALVTVSDCCRLHHARMHCCRRGRRG